MTLEDKVGQLLMVVPREDLVRRVHAGTVVLMDRDVDSESETRQLTADLQRWNAETSRVPLWVHGFITTKEWAGPRDGQIAQRCALQDAEELCYELGRRWRHLGLHTYPSPTVNVPIHETCIMRAWAISDDPDTATRYSRAITRGLIRAGCGTMAQHFPAHGATAVDSHQDVPVIELSRTELMRDHIPPYQASFREGCTTICTAHLRCPALDPDPGRIATTSRPILTDFLRGELGFRGVTIADAIGMVGFQKMGDPGETCVEAVAAGCDSICVTSDDDAACSVFESLLRAAGLGQLTETRLNEAVGRNLSFKQWLQERAPA